MGRFRTVLAAASAAVLVTSAVATAQSTVDSRLTNVTFSGPVSLPGKTIPAGTYQFRLADSPSNRNIVQVFDHDQHLVATMLAVPADRQEAQGDPVITFKETRSDQPPAVHFWYYAGEKAGSELVYPKSQAMMIAKASGESVMATDSDATDTEALKASKISRVTAADTAQQSTTTPTTQPDTTTARQQPTTEPSTTPVTTAPTTPTTTAPTTPATTTAPTTQPSSQPTTQPSTTPDETQPVGTSGRTSARSLPHTASRLPLIGLIGLFSLAGAVAVRAFRQPMRG